MRRTGLLVGRVEVGKGSGKGGSFREYREGERESGRVA